MKRPTTRCLTLAALLLLGGAVTAHADIDVYNDATRHGRSDDILHADTDTCSAAVGAQMSGTPTSRPFKRCMLSHGWRFDHTRVEHTWVDPDTGLTCKAFQLGGITGSDCSNF